jgi:hypothetical protein
MVITVDSRHVHAGNPLWYCSCTGNCTGQYCTANCRYILEEVACIKHFRYLLHFGVSLAAAWCSQPKQLYAGVTRARVRILWPRIWWVGAPPFLSIISTSAQDWLFYCPKLVYCPPPLTSYRERERERERGGGRVKR